MHTIVLASQKGGSGKTTLAAHLAVALERDGRGPAVLIDTDPQGSLSRWWNKREAPTPAFADANVHQLAAKLAALRADGFAWCIVDTPPADSEQNAKVITEADLVLIPTRPSPHDLDALGATLDLCQASGRRHVFVVNAAKSNASITIQTVTALSEHGQVAPAVVADRVLCASSMIDGRTVFEVDPSGKSAQEMSALWKFVDSLFAERRSIAKPKEKALVEARHVDQR
jgi:chromosome partitioning protein